MKRRTKFALRVLLAAALLGGYPAFVFGYTWLHVLQSELPGGRNGPLDAYRHTLASAVVAYTLGPKVVNWVTEWMETGQGWTHRMDRHNNRIGIRIGTEARSFRDIEPQVARQVAAGKVYAQDPDQSAWMHEGRWENYSLW